jgi:integrase/recombinase XerD
MSLVVLNPQHVQPTNQGSLADLIQKFLDAQDVAESSKLTYERQLRQFVNWLHETGRDQNLGQLRREDILSFKKWLGEEGKSSYTVSGYLTVVRKLFQWLESEKIYPDVTRNIKGAKRARGHRKDSLTISQIREVLGAIDTSTVVGLRNFALINLLVRTGLRTIEVARAEVADLRQESGEAVLWVRCKGRDAKDEFVLLMDVTLKPLRTYLSAREPLKLNAPLFCSASDRNRDEPLTTRSISRIVKTAFRAVGLDDSRLTAHSLRHSSINLALAGGCDVIGVQQMAHHASILTTMQYVHNLKRVEDGAEKYINF